MLTDYNPATTETFKHPAEGVKIIGNESINITFKVKTKINCITLNEALSKGQSIKVFEIILDDENAKVITRIQRTTIGYKRIITFQTQQVKSILIHFIDAKDRLVISEVGAYLIDKKLVEK